MQKVLITGGTGMVGKRLTKLLIRQGYSVSILSRKPLIDDQIKYFKWNINKATIDIEAFKGIDTIIHLAGANIGKKKWTDKRKKEIYNSRIDSTKLLFDYAIKHCKTLKTFISASGIGFYGTKKTDIIFDESNKAGNDFLSYVCKNWEQQAMLFKHNNIRTVILRTGVVLTDEGGIIAKMMLPVKLGLNAPIGNGKQFIPWIHIEDLCRLYIFSIENEINGIYNAVASEHSTNIEFSKALSKTMEKPFFMPKTPEFIIKLIL